MQGGRKRDELRDRDEWKIKRLEGRSRHSADIGGNGEDHSPARAGTQKANRLQQAQARGGGWCKGPPVAMAGIDKAQGPATDGNPRPRHESVAGTEVVEDHDRCGEGKSTHENIG